MGGARRVGGVAVLVTLVCSSSAGCDHATRDVSTCFAAESHVRQRMEHVAASLMGSTSYGSSVYSGCEDKGLPAPVLYLTVPSWEGKGQARQFLVENGLDEITTTGGGEGAASYRAPGSEWALRGSSGRTPSRRR